MKLKQKIILGVFAFSLLLIGNQALASNTNGTIDSTYHFAWGENIGFVDFKNITITDSTLSGSIYGENIGWVDLSTITNNNEGTLSGYAWGENIGWVDFSDVIINNNGIFTGQAYGENIGFITFNTNDNNKVLTDWRPLSSRPTHTSSNSGSSPRPQVITIVPSTKPAVSCPQGDLFDTKTGSPCLNTNTTIFRTLKLTTPRMTGTDIKDLQNYLNNHNYNCGVADGVYGTKTKATVILFQLANNLKGDGVVGPLTKAILK